MNKILDQELDDNLRQNTYAKLALAAALICVVLFVFLLGAMVFNLLI